MANKDDDILNKNAEQNSRILYRVRRSTSARSEIIPENEKHTDDDKLVNIASSIAESVKKPFGKHKEESDKTRQASKSKAAVIAYNRDSALRTKMIFLTLLICGIIIVCTFIFIPLAFASETKTVYLNDSGREFTAETSATTVGEFLENNGITLGESDMLEQSTDTLIEDEMNIVIRRAMDLTVNTKDNSVNVTMLAGTVADALDLAGVEIKEGDEIYPDTDTYIRAGMTIDYIEVITDFETETQAVGYKEITKETDELYEGETKLSQEGKEGEKTITYKLVYKNGALYSREVYSEEITTEPQNEITLVGTKEKPQPKKSSSSKSSQKSSKSKSSGSSSESSSGSSGSSSAVEGEGTIEIDGTTYNVKAVYNSQVTAYCSHCDPSGVGSSGAALTYGSLAANKSIFPYGTKIYIPGYGIGYVVDTGVSGTNIDVYMGSQDDESACEAWGRKNLKVYVLE